jgi:uncharacterized protein (TIGR02466 family)
MKNEFREIWSTPVGEYYLENNDIHNEVVQAYYKEYNIEDGTSFNILDTQCDKFKSWVLSCCEHYTSQFLNKSQCEIKRAWITTLNYGEHNHFHTHGDTDIVGVYYVETNIEHPELQVFDPRTPHSFNSSNIIKDGKTICENIRYILIPATKFKLVLLPGYLLHGVGTNLSKEARVSVAMNIKVK